MQVASLILILIPTAVAVAQAPQSCPVSKPSALQANLFPSGGRWFGGPELMVAVTGSEWTNLPRWEAPTIESVLGLASGSLPWRNIPGWQAGYRNKVVWLWDGYDPHADPTPPLAISGRRLDGTAPPLISDANRTGFNGNGSWTGDSVFVMSGVLFPTTGCWEITGKLRDKQLRFVVFVGDSENFPKK